MQISETVLDVLSNSTITGAPLTNALVLPGKLDRNVYLAVNKVLEAAGFKWSRKAQAHLFDGDASEIMDQIILTGQIANKKQELGDFPSPPAVVERLIQLADIEQGMLVLEPEAGEGAIAVPMAKLGAIVHCFEINKSHCDRLAANLFRVSPQYSVQCANFLDVQPLTGGTYKDLYDRIVMNPPFAKQDDIRHVTHALKFLAPGGRLVSVMAAGVKFRTNKLTQEFKSLITDIEDLPENSFAESGTAVNTVIVTIQR